MIKKIEYEPDCDWVAFSATIDGVDVRISVPIEELDIVPRDNSEGYDVTRANLVKLDKISFEDVY